MSKQNARNAAIDIGNDSLKGFFGSLDKEQRLYIPNVIAVAEAKRKVIKMENNPLDGLHVEIASGALKNGKGIYFVGPLASTVDHNDELRPGSEKSENDQSIILLLTALAYDAVRAFPESTDGIIDANYLLSTGLPLTEIKNDKRKAFRNKLKNEVHQVRFLDTPEISGKTVRISFANVLVNTEGYAAIVDLTKNEDGSNRNEELEQMIVLVSDIGGLSTDNAIIFPNGDIDNENSDGTNEGVSKYLDKIMKEVADTYTGFRFKSRKELVECITSEVSEKRNHITYKGNRQSIQNIVDKHLMKLAKDEYILIKDAWEKVPSINVCYNIGGGAILLKPYLEQINAADDQYPLRFVTADESVWMIARSYYKSLVLYQLAVSEKNAVVASKVE